MVVAELVEHTDIYYNTPRHVRFISCTRRYSEENGLKIVGTIRN